MHYHASFTLHVFVKNKLFWLNSILSFARMVLYKPYPTLLFLCWIKTKPIIFAKFLIVLNPKQSFENVVGSLFRSSIFLLYFTLCNISIPLFVLHFSLNLLYLENLESPCYLKLAAFFFLARLTRKPTKPHLFFMIRPSVYGSSSSLPTSATWWMGWPPCTALLL
jgi:hypothetical protein